MRTLTSNRNVYATISYTPSADLDKSIQDIAVQEMQDVKQLPGFSPNVIFQPLHENAIRAGKDRGGNALGIESDGPLTCKWTLLFLSIITTNRIQWFS